MNSEQIHNAFSDRNIRLSSSEAGMLSEYWNHMQQLRESFTDFPFADAEIAPIFVSRTGTKQ